MAQIFVLSYLYYSVYTFPLLLKLKYEDKNKYVT